MQVQTVFVGKPTSVEHQGKMVSTGIFKEKVEGPVQVKILNLEGDQQADLRVHGGVDKAVYVYPQEHYAYWKEARPDLNFDSGVFGENLSVSGMSEKYVCIGDRFQIGSAEFQVTSPRMPCFKLGIKMKDPKFVKEFMQANLNGFYLRVLKEGTLMAQDAISKIGEDGYGLSVDEVARAYFLEKNNKSLLEKASQSSSLPEDWRSYYEKKLNELRG